MQNFITIQYYKKFIIKILTPTRIKTIPMIFLIRLLNFSSLEDKMLAVKRNDKKENQHIVANDIHKPYNS